MDDEQIESCNFLSCGSWFAVRFLSLKEHCSLNKYLNTVALPVVGSHSLSVGRCLELATKVKKDFFHWFAQSVEILSVSKKIRCSWNTLYSSISLWVLSGF